MSEDRSRGLCARRRPGGACGVRHHLLVIPSVLCAAHAARLIADGVPGGVAIEHQHGCSQLGGDARLTAQVLTGLGAHPNVAATLVVGLGCETVQGPALYRAIEGRGQRAAYVGVQQAGGTLAAIRAGHDALAGLRDAAAGDPDVPIDWHDLRIGVEGTWLMLPDVQARIFADAIGQLTELGATVLQAVAPPFAGPPGGVQSIIPPALARFGPRTVPYAHAGERPRSAGGIDGTRVLLMRAPETRIAQKTGLAAAGAHVILSALIDTVPAGCPVAPVVHVGVAPAARAFSSDVEVMLDAAPAPEAAAAIVRALRDACRRETAAEALGTFEMAIHRIAPTM